MSGPSSKPKQARMEGGRQPPRPAPRSAPKPPPLPDRSALNGMHDRPTPRSTVIPRLPAPTPVPEIRPRMPTLIFHGAPPLAPLTSKPPPLPAPKPPSTRRVLFDDRGLDPASADETARNEARMALNSADVIEDSDAVVDGARDTDARDTPSNDLRFARTDRPPARAARAMPWGRAALVAACVVALAWRFGPAWSPREQGQAGANSAGATSQASQASQGAMTAANAPIAAPPGECVVAGAPQVIARRALVKGGVEATALDGRLGFGVVTATREGAAFEVDASSLTVTSTTRMQAIDPVRRVVPALFEGAPLEAEIDRAALRVVSDPEGDALIGVRAGYVVWSARDDEAKLKLWKLEGNGDIEAPRVVALGAGGERALTFRRAGAIWVGAFHASEASPSLGAMVRVSDGAQVGAPSIDARGDEVIVAWAQKDTRTSPWGIRWARWNAGAEPDKARPFTLPAGGPGDRAIAPSVAALDGGRFLLAWTEGATSHHQVRAQVIDELDRPHGEAFAISPADALAGQEQIAIARGGQGGRGAIAYLVAKGRAFQLMATPIACDAPKP